MMGMTQSTLFVVGIPLLLLYIAFWIWWGGNGKPMTAEELAQGMRDLEATDSSAQSREALEDVRALMTKDDGKEFVMVNLVRHRPKALYPPGYHYSDSAREADQRYGKSIAWPLLRNGNLVIFVARRSGVFITPEGADAWNYTAMVRYRSHRDFLRFAIESNQADKFVHKWAAIEKTHVFPVKSILNLFAVRTLLGLLLFFLGAVLFTLLH